VPIPNSLAAFVMAVFPVLVVVSVSWETAVWSNGETVATPEYSLTVYAATIKSGIGGSTATLKVRFEAVFELTTPSQISTLLSHPR